MEELDSLDILEAAELRRRTPGPSCVCVSLLENEVARSREAVIGKVGVRYLLLRTDPVLDGFSVYCFGWLTLVLARPRLFSMVSRSSFLFFFLFSLRIHQRWQLVLGR